MWKKKGSELEVGDIVEQFGLVMAIEPEPDPEGFWGGKPNITYINSHDAYYGQTCGEFNLEDEFKVLTDRKQIVSYLKKLDSEMAKYIANMMQLRKDFKELKWKVVGKINEKMRDKYGNL